MQASQDPHGCAREVTSWLLRVRKPTHAHKQLLPRHPIGKKPFPKAVLHYLQRSLADPLGAWEICQSLVEPPLRAHLKRALPELRSASPEKTGLSLWDYIKLHGMALGTELQNPAQAARFHPWECSICERIIETAQDCRHASEISTVAMTCFSFI